MTQGLLYVATGNQYVSEAIQSYHSFKEKNKAISAVIYTDSENEQMATSHFDNVKIIKNPVFNFLDKIEPMKETPFDLTLFVDTDTFCNENIDSLWNALDHYEMAFAFDTGRINDPVKGVPDWFCEYSTGVILYKKTKMLNTFIERWKFLYLEMLNSDGFTFDQTSFRKTVWEIKPNFFLLPQEYNFYTFSLNISAKNYPVKIFHGRYNNIKEAVSYLKSDVPTLYVNDLRFLNSKNLKSFNYHQTDIWIFRLFVNTFNFYHRLAYRFRFSKNALYQKKKGNR